MKKNVRLFLAFLLISSCQEHKQAATDWTLMPFEKADWANPILQADSTSQFYCPVGKRPIAWESKDVFNPAALVRNDTIYLLYRAEDLIGKYAGTSRIGLAWSTDGYRFQRHPEPVLYPDNDSLRKYEWEGGCEDPRVVEDEHGRYYLTYTAYDGSTARLMTAWSADLLQWTKTGPAFGTAKNGLYRNLWSKSGAIICRSEHNKMIAQKINGKYWMYWGDTDIFLASSDDLLHWIPVEAAPGKLLTVFGPRKGSFDSDLVEPGPPALYTPQGILLLYNSRNVPSKGDPTLPEGTYTAGQILLDNTHPEKVLARTAQGFLKPDRPYEIDGQVNHVCFIEGLVRFKQQWFLYYGTADSRIAVAVKKADQ